MSNILNAIGLSLVGYLALVVVSHTFSAVVPVMGFYIRMLIAYTCLVLCASIGVFSSIFLRLIGYQRISQWFVGRCFKYTMWYTTGITFTIDDPHDYLSKTRPAIFVGNHQTELDVLMLGCIFPKWCSVTAKRSLKNLPFLGWFMTLSGTVFIDRANSKNARQAMAGASDEISREKQSVYMFPEGTRSYTKEPTLLPFKKGAFHLAIQSGVPIVPVVVANYSHILHPRTLTFKSGEIPIRGMLPLIVIRAFSCAADSIFIY